MTNMSSNSRRIAKNTLLLYFRMLLLMLISLYTSRVVLKALGVEDYGIYNVVGGVVTMFTMLSGSLNSAISRFITFELGIGNIENLKRIFSSSVTIQVGLALIIVVIAETLGLWFLNEKMIIPENRMTAANWCFQFSIITFSINLISVPYNASIIAHERMSAFAYISIFEAAGKLLIAWFIELNPVDRLIFFAGMICVLSLIIRTIYGWYCKHHFEECTYSFIYDKDLLKRMFSFSGWNFIGASSLVLRNQGSDILLNLFFGPTINAARGLAFKIDVVITQFVNNFMTAINPQITKSYANGDKDYMFVLIFKGARFSYYILLLLALPVILNTHFILAVWLSVVPEHTELFVQLILVLALCESISGPLITAMLATGKIKKYQIVVGGFQMMNLPVAYACLHLGAFPESILLIAIIISQFCLAIRLIMLKQMIRLKVLQYLRNVYLNVIIVTILASIIPYFLSLLLSECMVHFLLITFVTVSCVLFVEYSFGLSKNEREYVNNKVILLLDKYNK